MKAPWRRGVEVPEWLSLIFVALLPLLCVGAGAIVASMW